MKEHKTLNEMTKKLDELLDWLVDSPMDNRDYSTIHRIFDRYLEEENNESNITY